MALQISGLRRNLKNIAHNYTDAQIKVREATSNDPWGPSSTLMSEVADLTYNVVAFTEIMQMVWKRLNDHGRNWRHVYKALVLLEYLIKTGSEKVADQCKENIFAIQTLKDFQYIEENKDQGMNVREKAKALVSLLKDDERLRNERVRALKAKERFAQSVSGIGSDSDISSPTSPSYPDTYVTSTSRPAERNSYGVTEGPSNLEPQLEAARPQTVGEEELQLQLALAMSKEEAEQEEQKKRSDDVRLQMAITQSAEDFKDPSDSGNVQADLIRTQQHKQTEDMSAMNDLLDINFNPHGQMNGGRAKSAPTPPAPIDPWGMPAPQTSPQHNTQPTKTDPWGGSPASGPPSRVTSPPTTTNDPWAPQTRSPEPPMGGICGNDPWAVLSAPPPANPTPPSTNNDPWNGVTNNESNNTTNGMERDPFAPISPIHNGDMDEFSAIVTRDKPTRNGVSDAFDLSGLGSSMSENEVPVKSKSPAAFLGENSNLVNLDNLVSTKQATPSIGEVYSNNTSTPMNNNYHQINNNFNNTTTSSINSTTNPFASPGLVPQSFTGVNPFSAPSPPNPFQAQQTPKPSMNQLRTTTTGIGGPTVDHGPWGPPQPSTGFGVASSGNGPQEENPFFL